MNKTIQNPCNPWQFLLIFWKIFFQNLHLLSAPLSLPSSLLPGQRPSPYPPDATLPFLFSWLPLTPTGLFSFPARTSFPNQKSLHLPVHFLNAIVISCYLSCAFDIPFELVFFCTCFLEFSLFHPCNFVDLYSFGLDLPPMAVSF